MNRFWSFGLSFAALLVAGCSSDDSSSLGTGDGGFAEAATGDGGSDGASGDTGPLDAGTAETGNDGGDKACNSTTTKAACTTCCANDHMAGVATFNGAIASCGCEQANCATACATTLCATNPTQPDQPCTNCLAPKVAMGGACYQPILTACEADPDCVAYFGCTGTNGAACSTKP